MAHHSRTPAFLQPNTVRSSRAAIFDDYNGGKHRHKHRDSNRPGTTPMSQDSSGGDSDSSDDDSSKLLLERLRGQLQGSIQVQDQSTHMDVDCSDNDQSVKSKASQDDMDPEAEAMEFRLFASQDTPVSVTLAVQEPKAVHVHYERPELDESPRSLRMKQISEAAIDATTILEQAQVPWPRTFFAHKVSHIPFKQSTDRKASKKSKRKREWEKKVKAGIIDQATIDATARKVRVSESWGQPFLSRKGLDQYTIASETTDTMKREGTLKSGRGRGGARGHGDRGNGRRGGSVGRGKGRPSTADRTLTGKVSSMDSVSPSKVVATNQNRGSSKPKRDLLVTKTSSPVVTKAVLGPQTPMVKEPVNKLDNMMAILTGK